MVRRLFEKVQPEAVAAPRRRPGPIWLVAHPAVAPLVRVPKAIGVQHVLGSANYSLVEQGRRDMAQQFDFVVVGGGSAGAVIASRLSEDPTCRVALIEAGERPPEISALAIAPP